MEIRIYSLAGVFMWFVFSMVDISAMATVSKIEEKNHRLGKSEEEESEEYLDSIDYLRDCATMNSPSYFYGNICKREHGGVICIDDGSKGDPRFTTYEDFDVSGTNSFTKKECHSNGYSMTLQGKDIEITEQFLRHSNIGLLCNDSELCHSSLEPIYSSQPDRLISFISNSANSGGVIYVNNISENITLRFEDSVFSYGNYAKNFGGFMCVYGRFGGHPNTSIVFNEIAIFEENYARSAIICLKRGVTVDFSNGLIVHQNKTCSNAAIHMDGFSADNIARINIVQNNLWTSTTFMENKSNEKPMAVYMEKYSALNFIIHRGSVELYDTIDGNRNGINNNMTIEGEGWFNLKKGSSIGNISLSNRGNLNLVNPEVTHLDLINFRNYGGTVAFGIFPEDGKCDRIEGNSILLGKETTIEILAYPGNYKAGYSYSILTSKKKIVENAKINLVFQSDMQIEKIPSDGGKSYTIKFVRDKFVDVFPMNMLEIIND